MVIYYRITIYRNIVDMCQLAICSYDIATIINRFSFLFSKKSMQATFLSGSQKSLCGEAYYYANKYSTARYPPVLLLLPCELQRYK